MEKMLRQFKTLILLFAILGFFLIFGCLEPDSHVSDNGPPVSPEFNFDYPPELVNGGCESITLSSEKSLAETTKELIDSSVEELKPLVTRFFSQNNVTEKPEKMKLILRFAQTQIETQTKFFDVGLVLECPLNTIRSKKGINAERINLFASMAEAAGFDSAIVLVYSEDGSRTRFFAGIVAEEETLSELDEYFYFEFNGKKYLVFLPNSVSCEFSCHPGELFAKVTGDDKHRLSLNEGTHIIKVGQ